MLVNWQGVDLCSVVTYDLCRIGQTLTSHGGGFLLLLAGIWQHKAQPLRQKSISVWLEPEEELDPVVLDSGSVSGSSESVPN